MGAGRPVGMRGKLMAYSKNRNQADMFVSISHHIDKTLWKEISDQVDSGEIPLTVAYYVSRYPVEQQRKMLAIFRKIGARGAKRYFENTANPPDESKLRDQVFRVINREFVGVPLADLADALRFVAAVASADAAEQAQASGRREQDAH